MFIGRGRPGRPGTARPKTSHARKYTVQFGKIEVKIYQGDITTANVDVVVYSSNTQCDLRQGLCKVLLVILLFRTLLLIALETSVTVKISEDKI